MQYLFGNTEVEVSEAECLGVGAVMPNDLSANTLFEMVPPTNLC